MSLKTTAITLAVVFCAAAALRVCHHNDFQARYIEVNENNQFCTPADAAAKKCFSSVARLKTAMDTLKCDIRISAGDFSFGTVYWTVFDEEIAIAAYNALQYDIAIFGIEDVTIGFEPIFKTIAKTPQITWLGSNINFPKPPSGVSVEKALNKEGVCWVSALTTLLTDLYDYTGIVELSDPVQSIRSSLLKCNQKDNVVAVTHLGFEEDIELCKSVPELDLVIGGFTQKDLAMDGSYPRKIVRADGTICYVVTAFAFGRQLGFLDLNFQSGSLTFDGYGLLPMDGKISLDKKVQKSISKFTKKLERQGASREIARLTAPIDDNCFGEECARGNLICDALLKASKGVDACVVNSDFSRGSFAAGPVTSGDLLELVPFPNTRSVITLPGSGILDALENGLASDVDDPIAYGPFLQVAGMKVVFDLSREVGKRVVYVSIGGYPLHPKRLYKLVTSSFLALGNYRFEWKEAKSIDITKTDIRDIVAYFLRSKSPYTPVVDGRLKAAMRK